MKIQYVREALVHTDTPLGSGGTETLRNAVPRLLSAVSQFKDLRQFNFTGLHCSEIIQVMEPK